MLLANEESPTNELRFNNGYHTSADGRQFIPERLEQKWICRDGEKAWTEWRPIPSVCEKAGIRTPHSVAVMD